MLVLDRDGTLLPRAEASLLNHASTQQDAPDTNPDRVGSIVDQFVRLLSPRMPLADTEARPDLSLVRRGSP
jgi:hypothetical protein